MLTDQIHYSGQHQYVSKHRQSKRISFIIYDPALEVFSPVIFHLLMARSESRHGGNKDTKKQILHKNELSVSRQLACIATLVMCITTIADSCWLTLFILTSYDEIKCRIRRDYEWKTVFFYYYYFILAFSLAVCPGNDWLVCIMLCNIQTSNFPLPQDPLIFASLVSVVEEKPR